MRRDQRLQLLDDLRMALESEVGLDALLDRREPQLLQPGNGSLGEALAAEVGERQPAPQPERLAQMRGRLLRLTGRERRSPILEQPLEASQVELVVVDPHE